VIGCVASSSEGLGPQKNKVRFWVEGEKALLRARAVARAARKGVADILLGTLMALATVGVGVGVDVVGVGACG
jgi:hypothetical protein